MTIIHLDVTMAEATKMSDERDPLLCYPCCVDGISRSANGFCDTCNQYLCESCFNVHCDHVLLDYDSITKDKVVPFTEQCKKHGRLLEYYCKKHRDILCSVCVNLNHGNCGVSFIPDEPKDIRKKEFSSLKTFMAENTFFNLVRCGLGLKYTSEGLRSFIGYECLLFHRSLLTDFHKKNCNECTLDNLLSIHSPSKCPSGNRSCICKYASSKRRPCPNDICGKLYDRIIVAHRFRNPNFRNTNVSSWTTDYWEVAKTFLSSGYSQIRSVKDADLVTLLNIGINMTCIAKRHEISTAILEQCRRVRNEIIYNANRDLLEEELDRYFQIMIDVLSCASVLCHYTKAQNGTMKLKQLMTIKPDDLLDWRLHSLSKDLIITKKVIDEDSDYFSEEEDLSGYIRELKNLQNGFL